MCDQYEVDPLLRTATLCDRNLVVALLALSLDKASTILAINIKVGTTKRCLSTAAILSNQAQLSDPTRNVESNIAEPIQRVLKEQKRCKDMPNKREPAELIMIDDMCEL